MLMSVIFLLAFVLVFDFAWLSFQHNAYQRLVMKVQGATLRVNLVGAALSYVCVFLALVLVAIPNTRRKLTQPATTCNNLLQLAITNAGMLGFLMYGVFNFTNMAIFQNYDVAVALLDTMWGTLLFTGATYFTIYFFN